MAEKTLNTRIALKIDTLERWNSSTLPLKKGELAIATVAATAGSGLTEPVVMFKIGEDGVKTFSQLDWNVYAKASDVIAACKSEEGLTTFVTNLINNSDLASNADFTELVGRVDGAEDAIETLNGDASTAGSVAKSIADAIAALNLDTTYVKVETGKGLSTNDLTNELKGQYDAAYEHSQAAHAPENAQENVIEKVKVNGTEVDITDKAVDIAVPTDNKDLANGAGYLVAADITGKADANTVYTKTEIDETVIPAAKAAVIGTNADESTADTIYGAKAYADKAVADMVKAYITDEENPNNPDAIDKLTEIAAWIADDEAGAAKIIADVAANTQAITDLGNAADGKFETKEDASAKLEEAKEYTDALQEKLVATENGLSVQHALTATEAEKVGKFDETALTTVEGTANSAIQSVTTTAENGLKVTKEGTAVTIDIDDDVVFVFDCGDSTN